MNLFLILAVATSAIAFLANEFADKGSDWLFSVAGWLILTVVFYLLSLLTPISVGRKSQ